MIIASAKFHTPEAHGWCYGQGMTERAAREELADRMALTGRAAIGEITIREVPGETVPMEPLVFEAVSLSQSVTRQVADPVPLRVNPKKPVDRKLAEYKAMMAERKRA
jgi:hypothetical protein